MADSTTNYGLVKPYGSEKVDIAVINGNMDIIDTALNGLKNDLQTETDNLKEDIGDEVVRMALVEQTLGYITKNLLRNNCITATENGVTATVNDDGSITLTGRNTSGSDFVIFNNFETGSIDSSTQYDNNKKFYPNGKYLVSGGTYECGIQICTSSDNLTAPVKAVTHGSQTLYVIKDVDKYVWTRLLIRSGANFSTPATIYPMICRSEITDNVYEQYKPTIVDRLAALEERLAALEGGAV